MASSLKRSKALLFLWGAGLEWGGYSLLIERDINLFLDDPPARLYIALHGYAFTHGSVWSSLSLPFQRNQRRGRGRVGSFCRNAALELE